MVLLHPDLVKRRCAPRFPCRKAAPLRFFRPAACPVILISMSSPTSQPGKFDEVFRKVDNFIGSPISSMKIAFDSLRVDACRTSCTASGNRHEETPGLGARHGDRPAFADLALEERDHAPARAEHIAEPHHVEQRIRRMPFEHHPFGEPFRKPHDAPRVHRLVGRDHDELAHAVTFGERRRAWTVPSTLFLRQAIGFHSIR